MVDELMRELENSSKEIVKIVEVLYGENCGKSEKGEKGNCVSGRDILSRIEQLFTDHHLPFSARELL